MVYKKRQNKQSNYKDNPKYYKRPYYVKLYLGFQKTSADYRLFEYDVTAGFVNYVQSVAEERGYISGESMLRTMGINPDYYSKCKRGLKICSFRYCMFIVHKLSIENPAPITLIA
jgi:hypothetical protein